MDYEKLKDFFNTNDRFCRHCGIRITRLVPGEADAELDVTPNVMNSRNVIMGGAIMTLADFAFAAAANAVGHVTVSTGVTTTFIRPSTGDKLFAAARKIHHGRSTCLYQVDVTDPAGRSVAVVMVNGFIIDEKPVIGD